MNSTTSTLSTVTLKAKRDQSIRRKHPWVFSGGIKHIQGDPQAGDWVKVCANKGGILGWGHYAPQASIAVRMLTFNEHCPDEAWWHKQIAQAVAVRRDLNSSVGHAKCLSPHSCGRRWPSGLDCRPPTTACWSCNVTPQACTAHFPRSSKRSRKRWETLWWGSTTRAQRPFSKTAAKPVKMAGSGEVRRKVTLPPSMDIASTSIGRKARRRGSSLDQRETARCSALCPKERKSSTYSVTRVGSAFTR